MSVAVEVAVLKKTQEELGKYVKKPPLTDKLLNKPPFRFLHDIINAVSLVVYNNSFSSSAFFIDIVTKFPGESKTLVKFYVLH